MPLLSFDLQSLARYLPGKLLRLACFTASDYSMIEKMLSYYLSKADDLRREEGISEIISLSLVKRSFLVDL